MKRGLVVLAVAFLVADALAGGWILYATRFRRAWLLDVREAVFSSGLADPAAFDAPPEALVRAGFHTDAPELVAEWRGRLPEEVEYLNGVSETLAGRDPIEVVKTLVPLFSKNGGGGCGRYRDLLDNVQRLPRGEGLGCCSDHVQVLIALGSSLGLFVRQVHHMSHTMAEVWSPALGKWAFVDPHYAVMARDPDGTPLSLREMRERYLAGAPVEFEFIGTQYHRFATIRPQDFELYDSPDDFRVISTLWGNNVFEEDHLDRRLGFAPRGARQLVGLSAGVLPTWRVLDDGSSHAEVMRLRGNRRLYLGTAALLAVGTLGSLAALGLASRSARLPAEETRR
jgi:hypothetical protein